MTSNKNQKLVIFDTDMGLDDAWALQIILQAEKQLQSVKVLAITTVNGNTTAENAAKNTYRILDGVHRTDIPIYMGSAEPIIRNNIKQNFFGSNGFSDIEVWKPYYPKNINEIIQPKNAIEIIRELVTKHPYEITFICVAPLTNIALAIKAYPELKEKIKEVFIMGGNYKGRGNMLAGSEFNFYVDAEAAHIVLQSLICPVTILPLECGEENKISLDWRFNVLGQVDNENVKLLNESERIAFRKSSNYEPFDALLAAIFIFPEKCIEKQRTHHVVVELQGIFTRGQMVFYHHNSNRSVNIIELLNTEEIKNVLLWSAQE